MKVKARKESYNLCFQLAFIVIVIVTYLTLHWKTYTNNFLFLNGIPFTSICKLFKNNCTRSNCIVIHSVKRTIRLNDLVTLLLETPTHFNDLVTRSLKIPTRSNDLITCSLETPTGLNDLVTSSPKTPTHSNDLVTRLLIFTRTITGN